MLVWNFFSQSSTLTSLVKWLSFNEIPIWYSIFSDNVINWVGLRGKNIEDQREIIDRCGHLLGIKLTRTKIFIIKRTNILCVEIIIRSKFGESVEQHAVFLLINFECLCLNLHIFFRVDLLVGLTWGTHMKKNGSYKILWEDKQRKLDLHRKKRIFR